MNENTKNEISCPKCGNNMIFYHSMLTARCVSGCGILDGVFWSKTEAQNAIAKGVSVR